MANKYKWKSPAGDYEVEVEANDFKTAFVDIAAFQEVVTLEHPKTHGPIKLRVRVVNGDSYYEVVDLETGEAFPLGQTRKGNQIYPKWKNKDGTYTTWKKWAPPENEEDEDDTPKKKK